MPRSVFLTGGTGFVGRVILARLLSSGRSVVALARSSASARTLEGAGASAVPGDLLDSASLATGMKGCEVVYHAAGLNALCLRDASPLYRTNVLGSANVARTAARAGVRRLVYTSSAATLGEERGEVGRENTRHRGYFLSHYERSKFEAERAVREIAGTAALDVVFLNPASVQGPGRTGGSARLLVGYADGKVRVLVDSRLSLVDVEDCADAHLLAERGGKPGQRYVVSGATLTVREAIALFARVTGVEERPVFVPSALLTPVAAVFEAGARALRRRPPVCREAARTLEHGHAYDGSRAARELGFSYTPVEETVRRTLAWYVERGLVSRPLPALPGPGPAE